MTKIAKMNNKSCSNKFSIYQANGETNRNARGKTV